MDEEDEEGDLPEMEEDDIAFEERLIGDFRFEYENDFSILVFRLHIIT